MRISEIWSRAEVDEINALLRLAAAEQDRMDAEFSVETAEERALFLSVMYGGNDVEGEFQAEKLDKERLANRKTAIEIDRLESATAIDADRLDNALTQAKVAQISTDIAFKSRGYGHAAT